MEETQTGETSVNKNHNLVKIGIGLVIILGLVAVIFTGKDKDNINNLKNKETNMEPTKAKIITNMGDIEIEFFKDESPNTVENFIKLASSGFYNDIKFHRVIKDFMIQTGDPLSKGDNEMLYGTGGPGYQFADEISNIPLVEGIVAMANAGPNTNGSQFFIITAKETPWLQGHHTAFAKVISGMDVAHEIENVETNDRDLPVEPIIIQEVILE